MGKYTCENYARSLGLNFLKNKTIITSNQYSRRKHNCLCGTYCIYWFAVPHIAKLIFQTKLTRFLSTLYWLKLICDIISQMPGFDITYQSTLLLHFLEHRRFAVGSKTKMMG
jgi:hypothetical protein